MVYDDRAAAACGLADSAALPLTRKRVRDPRESPFYVLPLLDALGGLVQRHRGFWLRLAHLESSVLTRELQRIAIDQPIYITGLARSGTTIVHELVCAHRDVATHRSKDYPMLFTPYWWRRATAGLRPAAPRERVHRDGVMVNTESPDALEEMLWMAFFPRCHDPSVSNLLTAHDSHPQFESFYDRHIRKLLLAEGRTRYAAKANYHVARLPYLLRLFPKARFIIPVRRPIDHIASLIRQHRWFAQGQRSHRPALAYMRRSGHFEFGLDRRPIHLGDDERVRRIRRAWASGDEVRGQAQYWASVYGYLQRLLAADAQLRDAVLVVRYEDLCADPATALREIYRHCSLRDAADVIDERAQGIRPAAACDRSFAPPELRILEAETADVAAAWGY